MHKLFSIPRYIFSMSLGKSTCKCIKIQGRVNYFGCLFHLVFFFVLLLVDGFDTRELFITCTYIFPLDYTFFPWVQGNLFASEWKDKERSNFMDGFFLLDFFWVLLLVCRFDTRGLFIICTNFPPFHDTFFPWVWGNLFASVEKYKEGSIFWMAFFYWISSGFYYLFIHLELGG